MNARINKVCFIGSGTMGCFNALMAAVAGFEAVIFDVSNDALASAPERMAGMAGFLVKQGFFQPESVANALDQIGYTRDLSEAVSSSQLISESVPERLALKRQVLAELDALCPADTIITTNTSGLLVSDLEDVFEHGHRFAALHSHLGSRLFDVLGGQRTSQNTIDDLVAYVVSLNGKPLVLKKENPGYVLNAMIGPFLTAAMVLVIEGIASIEGVDRTWMYEQEASIGPFGLIDLFGINVIHDSWQKPKPGVAQLQSNILAFIEPYIASESLGAKSGKGFYQYPEPAYADANFLSSVDNSTLSYDVLLNALIESAIVIANNGVAEPKQIDDAWCFSMSLEKGPFALLRDAGESQFVSRQKELLVKGFSTDESIHRVEAFVLGDASRSPGLNR